MKLSTLFILVLLEFCTCTLLEPWPSSSTASSAVAAAAPMTDTYCPSDWGQRGNYCYGLRMLSLPWNNAASACRRAHANVVNYESLDELDYILTLIRDRISQEKIAAASVWLGLNSNFQWIFSTNSTKKPVADENELLQPLALPTKFKNSFPTQCAYVSVGSAVPGGSRGGFGACTAPPPQAQHAHGYMCKRARLPVRGTFYGDVVVADADKYAALANDAVVSRKVPPPVQGYWPAGPLGVPFAISSEFHGRFGQRIRQYLKELSDLVCGLKFRERNEATDEEFLLFRSSSEPSLCASTIGRTPGAPTIISVGSACFSDDNPSTLTHEIMHALGLPHEHQRFDRARYLKVIWDNIDPNFKNQFYAYDDDASSLPAWKDVPYDFNSTMHYGPDADAILSEIGAFQVLDENLARGVKIGQRVGPSKNDVRKLDKLFPCDARGQPMGNFDLAHETEKKLQKQDDARKAAENPKCMLEYNRDIISGDALATLGNHDKNDCCALCESTVNCRGFAWNDWQNGTCFLKSAPGPRIQVDDVVSGYLIARKDEYFEDDKQIQDRECPNNAYNTDILGAEDIAAVHGQYAYTCCRLCLANPRCDSYAWSTFMDGTCWLKSSTTNTTAATATAKEVRAQGVQSGWVRGRQQRISSTSTSASGAEPQCRMSHNKDIPNPPGVADLAMHSRRRQGECCAICAATPTCKAFAWNEWEGGTCYLKATAEPVVDSTSSAFLGVLLLS